MKFIDHPKIESTHALEIKNINMEALPSIINLIEDSDCNCSIERIFYVHRATGFKLDSRDGEVYEKFYPDFKATMFIASNNKCFLDYVKWKIKKHISGVNKLNKLLVK